MDWLSDEVRYYGLDETDKFLSSRFTCKCITMLESLGDEAQRVKHQVTIDLLTRALSCIPVNMEQRMMY